jgi:hypothetical protein
VLWGHTDVQDIGVSAGRRAVPDFYRRIRALHRSPGPAPGRTDRLCPDYQVILRPGLDSERRYSPPSIIATEKRAISGNPEDNPEEARVCTNHIERVNLQVRIMSRRFTRLTTVFQEVGQPESGSCPVRGELQPVLDALGHPDDSSDEGRAC